MESRQVGRSGVGVSRLILGCGNFGGIGSAPQFFGQGLSRDDAFTLMDAAWAAGIRTFDTADAYGGGRSETFIGEWLRERGVRRDEIVLATKVFNPMREGDEGGLAPERVRRQLDSSLARLGVDHVDLYLTHEPDPKTPVAETLAALGQLRAAGAVRAVGASNVDAAGLEEALAVDGRTRYEWVQNSYSLLDRAAEDGVLRVCAREGLGFTPFGPLAGGWLTGKYTRDAPYPAGSRMTQRPEPYAHIANERTFAALDGLRAEADARGVSMATLAHAWVLAHPQVDAVVIGPNTPAQLDSAVRSLDVRLDAGDRDRLTSLFPWPSAS